MLRLPALPLRLIAMAAFFVGLPDVSYASANDGLVGHWRFDAATASIPDLSGQSRAAEVSGGKVLSEDGHGVLALDGSQRIIIPACPALNLQAGFSIELKIKLDDATGERTLARKDGQFILRIDPRGEEGRISFFLRTDSQWEPRVRSVVPVAGRWHHLVATWDGLRSSLWVNGIPFSESRVGKAPVASDTPLMIASTAAQGGGIRGAIEYVKIYHRVLSPKEIISEFYGIADVAMTPPTESAFVFADQAARKDWAAHGDASVTMADGRMVIKTNTPYALVLNHRLNADIGKKDWIRLRMAVDRGSQARLAFVTTRGAGHIPFSTIADNQPHDYVVEPWKQAGWGGRLLALGLIPSNIAESAASVEYLRVTDEMPPSRVCVQRIFTGATFPRTGRSEQIIARLQNAFGSTGDLTATLTVPEGITLKGPAARRVPEMGYRDEAEIAWNAEAQRPCTAAVRVTVSGKDVPEAVSSEQTLAFHADPHREKASYVPMPVPAKTKYALWTHYCALWKTGTHMGWSKIEPWPERKPVLGWYNDGSPEVADWHIKYMLEHGISGVVYCWYRANVNAPVKQSLGHAVHDGLLKARYLSMIKFGIMWENGCGAGIASADDLMQNVLPFWIENYFSNPSYARVDGKPVLYVWIPSNLRKQLGGSENVRKALDQMREECKRRGLGGLCVVACLGQADKEALEALAADGWDATSAYGNEWTIPDASKHVGDYTCAPCEGFISQQEAIWAFKRDLHRMPDITAMMMGWDARPWHPTGFYWAENTPEKFRDLCVRAKAAMDAKPDSDPARKTGVFCCWNEFGEGHYIEPTRGNGFSYLDVIREVFCDAPQDHVDLGPDDLGMPSPESWYLAVRNSACLLPRKAPRQTQWSGEELAPWKAMKDLSGVEVRDGILRATSTDRDPALVSQPLELRASQATKVVIEMRLSQPAGPAQLFWSTASTPKPSEAAAVAVDAIADGQWHRYEFAVGKNPNWSGCVTSLRFDPATQKDVLVEIKNISIE